MECPLSVPFASLLAGPYILLKGCPSFAGLSVLDLASFPATPRQSVSSAASRKLQKSSCHSNVYALTRRTNLPYRRFGYVHLLIFALVLVSSALFVSCARDPSVKELED